MLGLLSNKINTVMVFTLILVSGCDCRKPPAWEATPYELEIPAFFPPMDIPADNPLTVEGLILVDICFGKKL